MPFYRDRVSVLIPAPVDDYGSAQGWTWDVAQGASLVPAPFPVDFQPKLTVNDAGDGPVSITTYRLHTPPGKALDFKPHYRLLWRGEQFTLTGELAVWASPDHPSGVDHLEADFTRVGASDGQS